MQTSAETPAAESLCPKCGKPVNADWGICPFCGESMKARVASPTDDTPATEGQSVTSPAQTDANVQEPETSTPPSTEASGTPSPSSPKRKVIIRKTGPSRTKKCPHCGFEMSPSQETCPACNASLNSKEKESGWIKVISTIIGIAFVAVFLYFKFVGYTPESIRDDVHDLIEEICEDQWGFEEVELTDLKINKRKKDYFSGTVVVSASNANDWFLTFKVTIKDRKFYDEIEVEITDSKELTPQSSSFYD